MILLSLPSGRTRYCSWKLDYPYYTGAISVLGVWLLYKPDRSMETEQKREEPTSESTAPSGARRSDSYSGLEPLELSLENK